MARVTFLVGLGALALTVTVEIIPPAYGLYAVTSSTNCIPSFISTPLTTVEWPEFSANGSVQVNLSSKILCASVANMETAIAFSFKDDNCTVYGLGSGTSTQHSYYHLIKVPPNDSLEEVARRKPTIALLHYRTQYPSLAVDGDLTDDTMYHSNLFVKPWWQLDLTEDRVIYQIQIYPRQHERYYYRFEDIEIRVGTTFEGNGDLSSYHLFCSYTKQYEPVEGHLLCSSYEGIVGRYISVQKVAPEPSYLQFNDMNVFVLKK